MVISILRAPDRLHELHGQQAWWRSFSSRRRPEGPPAAFRAIEALGEDRLPPGAVLPDALPPGTVRLTWVSEGAVSFRVTRGRRQVVRAGELQHLVAGEGLDGRDANASRTDWAHVVQLWLRPPGKRAAPRQEHRRFSASQRRGAFCLMASPDGRAGSLVLALDALVFSALLDPGHHLVHPLAPGRSAWLQVIRGAVELGTLALGAGDGAGFSGEHAVSLVARTDAEVLLLDLHGPSTA